ncbi:hypothetical protein [Edaphosphingomonas haloaromaticamans]|uniref:Uncharacterized protein n=1 Tax=Edaphosphingomonas haloaromaticamans TaxID=653954 RepID=A0A1S1HIQ1_9SPHN|nr:hypothetical protein [Sphingomonas haloaromaticamans]OHT22179.1 hypothetical protein BHE75_04203 [Sphingomonas haloaromaticamans]
MSQRSSHFKQSDVTRAVRGALQGGAQVASVAITPSGVITLKFVGGENSNGGGDDLDDRLDRFAAQ